MENNEKGGGFNFKWLLYGALGIYVIFSIFSGGDEGQDYIEETLEEPTQGIICSLQEQEKDLYKITDEELIANRDDSRIYVSYLEGNIDTFTIDEISITEANDPRRSVMRSVMMGGMLGYMMGRPMSSGLTRSSYANDGAYNKSSTGRNTLRSTARKSTVRKPSAKKGFGSSKSSRSYGG